MLLLAILCCGFAQGQYRVLYTLAGVPSDGSFPVGNLIFDQVGNLYGTTELGGSSIGCGPGGCGTVFELSPALDGSWTETELYTFCSNYANEQCLDGAFPDAGLALDAAGNLYGVTGGGGMNSCAFRTPYGCGTVFELSPPSSPGGPWAEAVLYNFCTRYADKTCLDGALPQSQLAFDESGNLYGTTWTGGAGGNNSTDGCCVGGTVFELSYNAGKWTETILHNFCPRGPKSKCPDGVGPESGVVFDESGNLYGTTESGGRTASLGGGTVYELSPDFGAWTETVLYHILRRRICT